VNSVKSYLILLLVATTVGGAVLAWKQYGDLIELRAAAMNTDERADLQKRVWDLEKANRELREKLSAQRDPNELSEMLTDATDAERPGRDRGKRSERGGPGGRGANVGQQMAVLRELMNKPEVQAIMSLQQKAAIEARYSALFKNLNLPPDQIEKLKTLLADRGTTIADVVSAARDQGIDTRENTDAFRKLVADAQNEINNSIKAVIGEQGFAQLTTYEQTLPQRNLVNELQQRLSYTSTPLTSAQAEQLVQILAVNAPQRSNTGVEGSSASSTFTQVAVGFAGGRGGLGGRGGDMAGMIGALGGPGVGMLVGALDGGGRANAAAPVTPAAVTQAQTVLAAPQLAALQQIQQQQQAQQQLRQIMAETAAAQATSAGNAPQSGKGTRGAGTSNGSNGTQPARKGGGG
jgi:hypothetical protein